MAKDDLRALRALIGRIASAVGPGSRSLEDSMGVGHGDVRQLVSGRRVLRASHLLGLASFLEINPAELFEAAYPEARTGARFKLAHWLGAPSPQFAAEGVAAGALAPEVEARMRVIAREEIAAARKRRGGSKE